MYSPSDSLNSDPNVIKNGGLKQSKMCFLNKVTNNLNLNVPVSPLVSSNQPPLSNQVKPQYQYKPVYPTQQKNQKLMENSELAEQLPVTIVCNLRSFFPKIRNFTDDFRERGIDAGLLSEIWEQSASLLTGNPLPGSITILVHPSLIVLKL